MKKYVSTKCTVYTIGFLLLFLLMIAGTVISAIVMSGFLRIVLIVFYVLVVALEGYIYFNTYYEIDESELVCKSGPFTERIPYKKIRTATKCKSYIFSMALSDMRIELKYGPSDITGAVFISPIDEETFLSELLLKNPDISIVEA